MLIGQKKYSAGIRALQAIVHAHPPLAVVHYQLGALLLRMGRIDEAIRAFDTRARAASRRGRMARWPWPTR